MPQSLNSLIDTLDALLAELSQAERAAAEQIGKVADLHRTGAANLMRHIHSWDAPPD